jgi:predicted outer membrane lipoprotein
VPVARWRRHPARAARVLTAGLSTAAAFGIVAALAYDSEQDDAAGSPGRSVEVRIGDQVGDDEARRALRAWLEGQPDLDRDGSLRVVDGPADSTSMPS